MYVIKCLLGAIGGAICALPFAGFAYFGALLTYSGTEKTAYDHAWRVALSVLLLFMAIGAAISTLREIGKEHERRRETERERLARRQRENERLESHRAAQSALHEQIVLLGSQAIELYGLMPKHLEKADSHLDQAEIDFSEGAFAPFWDAIEKAATCLGEFEEDIKKIKNSQAYHAKESAKFEGIAPQFPVSPRFVASMKASSNVAERMRLIVRSAQRNFQFSVIFEQRKTNRILVAGFKNLAQALDGIAYQISASIDDLSETVVATYSAKEEIRCPEDEPARKAMEESIQKWSVINNITGNKVTVTATRVGNVTHVVEDLKKSDGLLGTRFLGTEKRVVDKTYEGPSGASK